MLFYIFVLAIADPLHFCINFRISLSIYNEDWWNLNQQCIEFAHQFEDKWNLNNIESSSLWTWYISPLIYMFLIYLCSRIYQCRSLACHLLNFFPSIFLSWCYLNVYLYFNFIIWLFTITIWNATDFCTFTSYAMNCLNFFISSGTIFIRSFFGNNYSQYH